MKKYYLIILVALCFSSLGQKVELIARANTSESVANTFGQSIALRSFLVKYEKSSLALGLEVSANHWQTLDRLNELYISIEPFISSAGKIGNLEGYINWGPSVSFGFSENRPNESSSADLGVFQSAGIRYNNWLIEYHYRIGFREYQSNQGTERFSRFGIGIGYRL